MKLIDADKLKANIEKRMNILDIESPFGIGGRVELELVLDFITSLQQEQPENKEKIMNFFDAVGDCGFSQHDILQLKNIWKEAGCPPPKSQVADAGKMEQPEVDLENYISNKLRELGADLINHKPYSFNRGLNVGKTNAYDDILNRLKARKKE